MSKTIDSRVVEMRFDNKQFESNAKQTMSTLERLKNALKFSKSSDALNGLGKAASNTKTDLSKIAESVTALQKRFSFLGETTRKVANNIRDSLVTTVGGATNFVKDSIVSGGIRRAMNIENAHYQLQALLKDEAKVQEVMDNAMESVDGTAYAFDEAAKASSMFAASGIKAGPEMVNALKGIVGTAAMTNAEFERISLIFTSVAGQGRLMGDQLLQLSSLGLNAPATIAEFFNKIDDSSTKASDEVRKMVKELTNGKKVTEANIRDLVSDGEIKFKIFAEAMYNAFGESAEKANETFNGALSNIKAALARIGAEFVSPLVAQNSAVVKLFNSIREKVNDVKKALTFDKEKNNIEALSKRFTDTVLGMAKATKKFVDGLDVESGMKVFYNVFDSVLNVFKGLGSVLGPVAKAFADVFLSFKVGSVIEVTSALKKLTDGFRLSEEGSKNLHDAFQGIFSVVKLVIDVFFALVRAIFPVTTPVVTLSGGILGLAGAMGRGLTAFTEFLRQCPLITKGFDLISGGIKLAMTILSAAIGTIIQFVKRAGELKIVSTILSVVIAAFQKLGDVMAPYVDHIIGKLKSFGTALAMLIPVNLDAALNLLYNNFAKLKSIVASFTLEQALDGLRSFVKRVKEILGMMKGSGGFSEFVENIKQFGENVKEAFNFDTIVHNLETFKSFVQSFVKWFGDTFSKAFSGMSIGGTVAGAGGIGIIYSLINMSKSFDKVTTSLNSIPKVLGAVSNSLKAYSEKLRAEAIKQVAGAIFILAAALVVLSFTDTEKVLQASMGLSAVSSALLLSGGKFLSAMNQLNSVDTVAGKVASGLKKAMKNLSAAVKWKAIGSAFKDFGLTIVEIAGSIIAIALMYRKDPQAMEEAEKVVATIAGVVTGIMISMNVISGKLKGSGKFMQSAIAVLALSTAINMCIGALKKLFKMDLPADYEDKLKILAGILGGLGVLAIALGTASRIAAGNSIKSGPILAMSVLLYVCASAVKKVIEIEFPSDYKRKLFLLVEMFSGLGALIIALGAAAKLAGGTIKAGGTLIALAVVIGTIVAALFVLSILPVEAMIKGAAGLSTVLLAVATGMFAASKITTTDTYKTVLAMAIMVGAITAALGVLSMVPLPQLAVSAAALGAMLLALAVDFNMIAKITNQNAWEPIVGMVAMVLTITISLVVLSQQPWDGMLAAGGAMSATMIAFGIAFKLVAESGRGVKLADVGKFLAATLAVIPIGAALYILSEQPWQGMIAAGGALTATVVAFGVAFKMVASTRPNLKSLASFLAGTLALTPIAVALYALSDKPYKQMLAAATALSEVILATSVAMKICQSVGGQATAAIKGIGLLDLFIADLAGVLVALGAIFDDPAAKKLLSGGASILAQIGNALGDFVGQIIGGALSGISDSFPKIGKNLTKFMTEAKGFFVGAGSIDEGAMRGVKYMAETILILTGADILQGLTSWLTGGSSMEQFGKELVKFGPYLAAYAVSVKGIDAKVVKNSSNAVKVLADMASSLPNSGGLAGKIFGENNLSDFGKELSQFGPYLSAYSLSIKTVDASLVKKSANAAQAMADMATRLPNSGGLAAKILGDNKLSAFGKELAKFGPYLSEYSSSIKSMDGGLVKKSANAAKVMADMAKSLPNSGGLAAKILGDNKLSAFGKELAKFGPYLSDYSNSIKNMDASVVEKSANAAKALAQMAKALPNSGGVAAFFTGDNSIEAFGKGLRKFGEAMADFYKSVKDISGSNLEGVIDQIKKVVDVIKGMDGVKSSSADQFTKALKSLAEAGVKDFVSAFDNSHTKVKTTMNNFIAAAVKACNGKNGEMKKAGESAATAFVTGIKNKTRDASAGAQAIARSATAALQQKVSEFRKKGEISTTSYIAGLKSKKSALESAAGELATKAAAAFGAKKSIFESQGRTAASAMINGVINGLQSSDLGRISASASAIGLQFVRGVSNGINSNMSIAKSAASQLAVQIDSQVKKDLEIHSPSKKAYTRGVQYVYGFVNAINDNANKPANAAKAMIVRLGVVVGKSFDENISPIMYKVGAALAEKVPDALLKALPKAQQAMVKSVEWSLRTEGEYWEKLLEIKKKGADAEQYQNMSILKFRKEMLAQSKEIVDQYNDQLQADTESIRNQINVFESVEKSLYRTRLEQAEYEDKIANKKIEADKKKQIAEAQNAVATAKTAEAKAKAQKKLAEIQKKELQNTAKNVKSIKQMLEDQTKAFDKYEKYQASLAKRLKNTNFLEVVTKLGMDQLPLLKELYQSTDKELSDISNLYDQTLASAENIAGSRLKDLRKTVGKELSELFSLGENEIYSGTQKALTAEEEYWAKLLEVKQAGADKEKYADMSIKQFRKEILKETKELIDSYKEQFESTRDSILSQTDIFTEIQKKTAVTKGELRKILKEQVQMYKEYQDELAKATKRLKGSGLLDIVQNLGVEYVDQLKVFNEMSDAELKELISLYDQKVEYAGEAATTKLADVRKKLKKELKELWGSDANIDIDEFLKDFDGKLATLEKYAINTAETTKKAAKETKDATKELGSTVAKGLTDEQAMIDEAKAMLQKSNEQMTEMLNKTGVDYVTAESRYWESLLDVKKKGIETEQLYNKEIEDLRQSVLSETQKLVDDYNKQLESVRDSIVSQMDLFAEMEQKETISKQNLQQILDAQVKSYREYADIQEQLAKRLEGTSLLGEIQGLGVASVDQLKVIASMTDDELSRYAKTYDQKLGEAERAAAAKLTDLRSNTEKELKELWNTMGEVDLTKFMESFDGTIESIEKFVLSMQKPFQEAAENIAGEMTTITSSITDGITEVLQPFEEQMTQYGSDYVQALSNGVKEEQPTAVEAVEELKESVEDPLENEAPGEFEQLGNISGESYASGIDDKQSIATSSGESLGNSALEGTDSITPAFETVGETSATNYTGAITDTIPEAENAGNELAASAASAVSSKSGDFYSAGVSAGQGYVDGLRSQIAAARAAAAELAAASSTSAESELDINSPSKVFRNIGYFAAIGFISELLRYTAQAGEAGKELGDASLEGAEDSLRGLRAIVTDNMVDDPIIRLEVDLGGVESAVDDINTLFNNAIRAITMDVEGLNVDFKNARNVTNAKVEEPSLQKKKEAEGGNTFNFIQNNNSPKALSTIDIYRQTNNQFRLFRTAVNRA